MLNEIKTFFTIFNNTHSNWKLFLTSFSVREIKWSLRGRCWLYLWSAEATRWFGSFVINLDFKNSNFNSNSREFFLDTFFSKKVQLLLSESQVFLDNFFLVSVRFFLHVILGPWVTRFCLAISGITLLQEINKGKLDTGKIWSWK